VAMMTYLGTQTARRIAGVANRSNAFEEADIPDHPLYTGNPWFLPVIGTWYQIRDRVDRMRA
jgi:gamma-glutamylputrescine oxidase